MVSQTSRTGSDNIFHDKRFDSMPKECESRFLKLHKVARSPFTLLCCLKRKMTKKLH